MNIFIYVKRAGTAWGLAIVGAPKPAVDPANPTITWISISAGAEGEVWAVNSLGALYRREGITAWRPRGSAWTHLPSCVKFRQVSVFNGTVWGRTAAGEVYSWSTEIRPRSITENFCPKSKFKNNLD